MGIIWYHATRRMWAEENEGVFEWPENQRIENRTAKKELKLCYAGTCRKMWYPFDDIHIIAPQYKRQWLHHFWSPSCQRLKNVSARNGLASEMAARLHLFIGASCDIDRWFEFAWTYWTYSQTPTWQAAEKLRPRFLVSKERSWMVMVTILGAVQ